VDKLSSVGQPTPTIFNFGWGFAPDPAVGAYSDPLLLDLGGLLVK